MGAQNSRCLARTGGPDHSDDERSDRHDIDLRVNVFIIAAGRRTSLVRAFGDAVRRRGGRLFAGDVDGLAPALDFADEVIRTVPADEPGYLDDILSTVERHGISLIVPTIDADLLTLAAAKESLLALGCRPAVSEPSFVRTTLDKYRTGVVFGAAGIHVPWSWVPPITDDGILPVELFVKPRAGSASQDTFRVAKGQLRAALQLQLDPVVQEVLSGPEITVDALLDFAGAPIHYVPRVRIRTLAGESVQGVTLEHDSVVEDWIERVLRVSSRLGAAGPLTIQAFLTPDGPVLSEINPRFGGGFPLALEAGGAYPDWLLDMLAGVPVPPRLGEYEAGLYMTRFHTEQFMRQPRW
jgi:carbamoyl-phosphate synthase large subunit